MRIQQKIGDNEANNNLIKTDDHNVYEIQQIQAIMKEMKIHQKQSIMKQTKI